MTRACPGPLAAAVSIGLAACAGPLGPVLGDWRADVPGPVQFYGQVIELVLDGTPDARSGQYHQVVTTQNASQFVATGTQHWDGTWTRETAPDGRPVFVLHDDLPGSITRYEWATDGSLRALAPDRLTNGAQLFTLFPQRPGYGYGRV